MLSKILVAVDGSEYSRNALDFACRLADKFGSELCILHIPQGVAADRVMVLGGASIMLHAPADVIEEAGLLGSVSHKVNHSAPCTCITVH